MCIRDRDSSITVSVSWPTEGLAGDHIIYVDVDADSVIRDIDRENNFASRTIEILPYRPCDYTPGDINGDGNVMGNDVTYGVRYFKGLGAPPPDSCWNDSTETWLYSAADANGSCSFTGSDITFLVAYFKGVNPSILYCPQTPPAEPPVLGIHRDVTPAGLPKK